MSALHGHHLATVAYQPCANDVEGRVWIVTVQRPGHSACHHKIVAVESVDATITGIELGGDGASVKVRPFIELTREEGRAVYPNEPHEDATEEARLGWLDAFEAERQRRRDWSAVVYQNSHPLVTGGHQ